MKTSIERRSHNARWRDKNRRRQNLLKNQSEIRRNTRLRKEATRHGKTWTVEEVEVLKTSDKSDVELARILGRTPFGVYSKRMAEGIDKSYKANKINEELSR